MSKKQVVVIHGGNAFNSEEEFLESLKNFEVSIENFYPKIDWKINLPKSLGDSFEVLLPRMPNKQNAKYKHWKIWFEKIIPFLNDGIVLIGHSLGGSFLIKYLSENNFPKKIKDLFLIAAANNDTEGMGDFVIGDSLNKIEQTCSNIHIFHSKDDQIVDFSNAEYFCKKLPKAKMHIFEDRQHFNQEELPELIDEILK